MLLKYNIPVRIMLLTVVCLMLFKNSFSANNQMIVSAQEWGIRPIQCFEG